MHERSQLAMSANVHSNRWKLRGSVNQAFWQDRPESGDAYGSFGRGQTPSATSITRNIPRPNKHLLREPDHERERPDLSDDPMLGGLAHCGGLRGRGLHLGDHGVGELAWRCGGFKCASHIFNRCTHPM